MGIQTETPMETLVGIQCDDCVLLMCDRSATRSIIRFNDEQDKIFTLDSHMAMASVQKKGGDSAQFSEYVQKNLKLYQLKTGTKLSTHAASNFIRGELARCLRQKPYYVDLLIGGHDSEGPALYYLDYMASMQKMSYACHGYAGHFVTATIDRYYTPGLTRAEGMELLRKCVTEINLRFMANSPNFLVKVVDSNGITVVDIAGDGVAQ